MLKIKVSSNEPRAKGSPGVTSTMESSPSGATADSARVMYYAGTVGRWLPLPEEWALCPNKASPCAKTDGNALHSVLAWGGKSFSIF